MDEQPTIGRERERDVLRGLLRRAAGDRTCVAVLAGEAGVGKSHLLAALVREAAALGHDVTVGRCFRDGAHPAGPWHELAPAAAPTAVAPADARASTFERVLARLTERAAVRPQVVALEDLQWADADSLLLLRHVARFGRTAILLVATLRAPDPDGATNALLDDLLAELVRDAEAEVLTLRPFTLEEVAAQARALAGAWQRAPAGPLPEGPASTAPDVAVPQAVALALLRETAGNPLYVREVLRHLLETGTLRLRDGRLCTDAALAEAGLPPSIHQLVRQRARRLGAGALALVRHAALAFEPLPLPVLARAAGLGDPLGALEEATAAGLVRGAVELCHAIVGRALAEDLTPARRAHMHRALAEACAEQGADPAQVAAHYHASRELPGAEAGLPAALEAAARQPAHRRAPLLALAVDLAAPLDVGARADVGSRHARALAAAGEPGAVGAALGAAELLAAAGRAPEAPALLAAVARELDAGGLPRGEWQELVRRGLSEAAGRRDPTWARLALLARAPVPVLTGPFWTARQPDGDPEAVRLLRATGDDDDLAASVDPHDARAPEETDALLARVPSIRAPAAAIRILDACARDLFFVRGDFYGTAAAMEELLARAVRAASPTGEVAALSVAGCAWAVLGDLGRAREARERARDLASRLGPMHRMSAVGPRALDVILAYLTGEGAAAATESLLAFCRTPRALGTPFGLVALQLGLLGAAVAGDGETARAVFPHHLRALQAVPRAAGEWGAGRDVGAAAAWLLGAAEHAGAYRALAVQPTTACACIGTRAGTAARMAALAGDVDAALPLFREARRDLERSGRRACLPIEAHDEALALLRAGRGADPRVGELLDEAERGAAALGLASWAQRARALRTSGLTRPDGLSEREAEVLALLAAGLANKEIAARLFVSVATVERHVANVYAKTGCRGRAAATAYALRVGLGPAA